LTAAPYDKALILLVITINDNIHAGTMQLYDAQTLAGRGSGTSTSRTGSQLE